MIMTASTLVSKLSTIGLLGPPPHPLIHPPSRARTRFSASIALLKPALSDIKFELLAGAESESRPEELRTKCDELVAAQQLLEKVGRDWFAEQVGEEAGMLKEVVKIIVEEVERREVGRGAETKSV